MPYSVDDFAAQIKQKYPQYASWPNDHLVAQIVMKHPEYRSWVQTGPPVDPSDPRFEPKDVSGLGFKDDRSRMAILGDAASRVGSMVKGAASAVAGVLPDIGSTEAVPGMLAAGQRAGQLAATTDPGIVQNIRAGAHIIPGLGDVVDKGLADVGAYASNRPPTPDEQNQPYEAIGALTGGLAVPKVAEATDNLAPRIGTKMIDRAQKGYTAAFDPTNPDKAATTLTRMQSEGVLPKTDLSSRLDAANSTLADAIAKNADEPAAPTSVVMSQIEKLKNEHRTFVRNPDGSYSAEPKTAADAKAIDYLTLHQKNLIPKSRSGAIALKNAVDVRDSLDKAADTGGAFDGVDLNPNSKVALDKKVADVLRDHINRNPDVGPANADVSYLLDAQNLQNGVTASPPLSLEDIPSMTAGAARIAGKIAKKTIANPNIKAKAALLTDNLGDALGGQRPNGPADNFSPNLAQAVNDSPDLSRALPAGTPPQAQRFLPDTPTQNSSTGNGYVPDWRHSAPDTPNANVGGATTYDEPGFRKPMDRTFSPQAEVVQPKSPEWYASNFAQLRQNAKPVDGAWLDSLARRFGLDTAPEPDAFGQNDAVHGLLTDALKSVGPSRDSVRQVIAGKDAVYVNPDGTVVKLPHSLMQSWMNEVMKIK